MKGRDTTFYVCVFLFFVVFVFCLDMFGFNDFTKVKEGTASVDHSVHVAFDFEAVFDDTEQTVYDLIVEVFTLVAEAFIVTDFIAGMDPVDNQVGDNCT